MATPDPGVRSRPRPELPTILFWLLLAALLLRIVMAAGCRGKPEDAGPGLVRWRPHEKAAAVSRGEGKRILYDFTAAWCTPCHRLDEEGWGDSRVASLVNDSYVPVHVVDRVREDGKNPAAIDEIQSRYGVRAFPTLVVADADGREIAKVEGWAGKERLVRFLEESRGKKP